MRKTSESSQEMFFILGTLPTQYHDNNVGREESILSWKVGIIHVARESACNQSIHTELLVVVLRTKRVKIIQNPVVINKHL